MTGKLAWAILGKPSFPLLSTDPNSPLSFHVLLLDLTLSPDHSSPYLRAPLHMAKWGGGTHYLKVPLFLNGQLFHLFLSIIFLWGFLSSGSVVLQVEPITSMETHPLFSPSFPTFDSLKKKITFWGRVDNPLHTFEGCNLIGFDIRVRLWNRHQIKIMNVTLAPKSIHTPLCSLPVLSLGNHWSYFYHCRLACFS